MGRKAKFDEKQKRGPGRKARKQKPPQIPSHLLGKSSCDIAFFLLAMRTRGNRL